MRTVKLIILSTLISTLLLSGYFATTASGQIASGGTITSDGEYWMHTFTNDGSFSVGGTLDCEVLVVAGGGAGGGGNQNYGGGGGGGGIVYNPSVSFEVGNYPVVVGLGGAASAMRGNNGGDSSINNLVAKGGGGGGHSGYTIENGANGGSGGGGASHFQSWNTAYSGSSIQTHAGGTGYGFAGGDVTIPLVNCGIGGGGAGGAGQSTYVENRGTHGGVGRMFNISGVETYYAGGGGGGGGTNVYSGGTNGWGFGGLGGGGHGGAPWVVNPPDPGNAQPGTDGLGGGGGGASGYNGILSGKGGSGIVIVRYLSIDQADAIVQAIDPLNVEQGVKNSYIANVKNVSKFVQQGNITPAVNELQAFVHKVEQDLTKGKISAADGSLLIGMAEDLIQLLSR